MRWVSIAHSPTMLEKIQIFSRTNTTKLDLCHSCRVPSVCLIQPIGRLDDPPLGAHVTHFRLFSDPQNLPDLHIAPLNTLRIACGLTPAMGLFEPPDTVGVRSRKIPCFRQAWLWDQPVSIDRLASINLSTVWRFSLQESS